MASKAKAILSLRIVSDADSKGFKKAVREIKAFEKKVNRSNSSLSKLCLLYTSPSPRDS